MNTLTDGGPVVEAKRKARNRRKAAAKKPAKPLSAETLADLKRSGLDAADARKMAVKDLSADDCYSLFKIYRRAYAIPYPNFEGVYDDFLRARFTEFTKPEIFRGETVTDKEIKYSQARGTTVHIYLPANVDWRSILNDPSIHIWITEGEKKSYAMCKAGFPCVGLGGVWSFRIPNQLRDAESPDDDDDDNEKKTKSKAKKRPEDRSLHPVLQKLAARGRVIIIGFDSDRVHNAHVQNAETALAIELRRAGAKPRIATLPYHFDSEKIGLDDLLVTKGRKAVAAVLKAAVEFTARDLVAGIRKTQKSNAERHRNVAEAIVAELKCGGDFIRTDDSLLYFDSTQKSLVSLDAEKDRELRAFIDDRTAVTGACPEWNITFERLADTAHTDGKPTRVYKLSHWDAATGTWYRAKSASKLFRATADGWEVVDNGTDGVLIHTRGQMVDVEVATKKSGKAAFETVVNVPNFIDGHTLTAKQARLLWAIYFLAIHFPEALPTRPIPLFNGPKGSGKTSGGRALLRTEYGDRGQVTAIDPKKFDALQAIVINSAVTCIDNIDGKHDGLQNLLATVATGGMVELRTLYTTMGKSEYRIDCFLIATSRDPKSFTRDDVADRLLYFLCGRREKFLSEAELIAMVDANRPRYWRWLLDLMPEIIKALKKAKTGTVHDDRMADFAKFAMAVGPVLGYPVATVNAALAAMNAEKLNFQSEHSSVLGGIGMYVASTVANVNVNGLAAKTIKEKEEFDELIARLEQPMTAAALLDAIKAVKHDFPYTNALNFGQALRNEATAIETKFDFKAIYNKRDKRWTYTVAPLGGYPTQEQIKKIFKSAKS